jgi:hypothetical protein
VAPLAPARRRKRLHERVELPLGARVLKQNDDDDNNLKNMGKMREEKNSTSTSTSTSTVQVQRDCDRTTVRSSWIVDLDTKRAN